jgi:phosphatidylserine/phosphatidylglycerophosphate/cardiolipin synthase-like enzyme
MFALRHLSRAHLIRFAEALEGGRLLPPFTSMQLEPYVPAAVVGQVTEAMAGLVGMGMQPRHVAQLVRVLAEERGAAQEVADRIQLVWSGTEIEAGTRSRDTSAVVQELFDRARQYVLVASFVLETNRRAAEGVLGALARRMEENPALAVRLYVNVKREHHDRDSTDGKILREFAEGFERTWPGKRLPEVYYDPRALTSGGKTRASMHAKCIVVDDEHALVSSANFTEAAHERNIEAGIRLEDPQIAQALRIQFETLRERGLLRPVPGLVPGVASV